MARRFSLQDEIVVKAPIALCFQLATSLEVVALDLKMRPVRGRTSGCVAGGETVLWRGWQLGLPQFHESLIEAFNPPFFFRDRMIAGRFAAFEHDHAFIQRADGTVLLQDEVRFTMPLGWPGWLAGQGVMVPHIRGLMRRRFARLRQLAEGDGWKAVFRPGGLGRET